MNAAIVAEGVRKSFGETVALSGVSLSVDAGEVFGLVGPNGAGKTTLVRALTGTLSPDAGDVELLGADPASVARDRVGLLPQDFRPHERLTARELVSYYRGLYDEGRDPDAALAAVGLEAAADTRYEDLSGGQQRRTCVATALVNDPGVLFLDEPTAGIDPAGRRTLWRLVEELAEGGATVFLTTHDMAEAERLADRVGLLRDGELVAVDSPDALVAEHGGTARLLVETDADVSALFDADLRVESTADGLVVTGVQPEDIGGVVGALEERDVDYESLTWSEPDLESAYLNLTGERYAAAGGGQGAGGSRGATGGPGASAAGGKR